MFVFLADEENRIEIPNRRAGRSGRSPAASSCGTREVGKSTLGAGFFLFDYVCCNRIIWGADQYTEVRIRHTKGAPDRWLEEVTPVLRRIRGGRARSRSCRRSKTRAASASTTSSTSSSPTASARSMVPAIKAIHETEEGRPIETLWDVTVAATAHARSVPEHRQAARNRTRRRRAAETGSLTRASPRAADEVGGGVEARRS